MSKLLERLKDATRSGVYRTSGGAAVREVARAGGLPLVEIRFADKRRLLDNIAQALEFPEWFGHNWDALEDCLTDLSWRQGNGHLLLFEGVKAGDDLGVLLDVLASAAQSWRERGSAFFAVFVDPERELALPDLYRES
jgi:hypothetical protein